MSNRNKRVEYYFPIVRHDQLLRIINGSTSEERLFRFLQFTRWLQNTMKRSWKNPLCEIGQDFIYGISGCNLDKVHRQLAKVSRVWARYGYEVIRKLKEDLQEYRSHTVETQLILNNTLRATTQHRTQNPTQRNYLAVVDEENCRDRVLLKEITEPDHITYLNILGQVISVMESSNRDIILRLWDGTKQRFNSFQKRSVYHLDKSAISRIIAPSIGALNNIPLDYTVDVICCAEWGRLAAQMKSGQPVFLRNVHFFWPKLAVHQPRAFYLRSGSAHDRGIFLLSPLKARQLTMNLSNVIFREDFDNIAYQHNALDYNQNKSNKIDNPQIINDSFWIND